MARIAFLGAGLMGEPMASRLLQAGHNVVVVAHRDRGPIDRLVGRGARGASTPLEAARLTDVAIMMLPTAQDVEAVLFGPQGLAEGLPHGYMVIDMGTSYPPDTRRLAARVRALGGRFVDAPVTGRPSGAKDGTLTIMVGGDLEAVSHVRPILEAMGRHIYYFGPVGSGHTAKLIQNMIGIACSAAIAEGFVLAAASQLNVRELLTMLSSLPSANPALGRFISKVLARDFDTIDVRLDMIFKDICQAISLAQELTVPVAVASGTVQVLQLARALDFGRLDGCAMIRGLENAVGVEVRDQR